MSKRNIRPNSGKQLYLNQIFYKGMLYTSSEMQEGFARVIDNYDIAPTGDAATPRHPLRLLEDKTIGFDNSYTVPVKFKQFEGKQSYIKFYKTISEEEFASDTQTVNNNLTSDITLINRNNNIINNEESGSISNEIRYTIKEQSTDEPEADPLEEIKNNYSDQINANYGLGFDATKNRFIYTQIYYDGTKTTQREVVIPYSKRLKSNISGDFKKSMTIIDGDTFKDSDNITHRLFGVDAREIGYEWSEYAKKILEKVNLYWNENVGEFPGAECLGYRIVKKTMDVYGRFISRLYICFKNDAIDPNYYYYIDVAEMLLSLGLVTMRYIDRTKDPDVFDGYKGYQDIARAEEYKIFSKTDFDPYYENVKANINISEGNNLQITEDMFIEAVKIKDGFNISALTQTVVDFVHTVYIDYLDAVGFIGRILQGTEIIYKGPILLQARVDDDGNEGFVVLLPSNQGEGVTPNLIEASTTNSYNLINDNMINIENEKDEYSAFNILGATVLYKDVSGNINTDNPQVITQGIIGQEVLLKAIINEEGFYNYSDITTTDNYGFEIVLEPIVVEGVTLFESRKINRAVNEFTNVTTDVLGLAYAVEQATKDMSDDEKSKIPTTWEGVLDKTNIKIRSITLIKNSNNSSQNVKLSANEINSTLSTDVSALWDGSVLEIRSELEIDNDELVINFHNNFSTINMTFTEGSNLVLRENSLPLEFYSKWLVSDYGNEFFRDIQSELLIYKKSGGTNTLTKVGDWTGDIIKPTDLSYVLSGNSNLSFKYSIQPKIHNKLSNSCPSTLSSIRLVNTFQEMYMIIPLLKIGTEIEVISDKDLRTNMNIKNATRIEVFNRQICVYGPYTTSNALFFSKFETFDYFPFPSGVIELEEPITWVYNYKDSFIIFGKNHLHMLTGATLASECTLHKIYENLSIHLPDVRITNTVGNNLIFFNNGVGYVIVPNTYVDSSSNIKVYKLTEYISNFFYNPEAYIRNRIPTNAIDSVLTYKMEFDSYVQNNDIVITNNITVNEGANEHHLVTWFIYNQDFKYWRMYSTTLFNRILANYVCEPNVNHQFIVEKDNKAYMSFFQNVYTIDYKDNNIPIKTMIDSGYLSVDTMNDKRFKDIIIEFDKIDPMAKLYMNCEFFVDGSPIILSDTNAVIIDKLTGAIMETEKVLSDYRDYELHHIGTSSYVTPSDTITREQVFGTTFEIDNQVYSTTGRTHMRIPVYGKGRLPSFILKIESDKGYEFINYALIYKEKNINRRS